MIGIAALISSIMLSFPHRGKRWNEVCLFHSRLAVPESYRKRESRWRRSGEVAKVRSGTYILCDISTSTSAGVAVNGNAKEAHASYKCVLGRKE